MDSPNIIRSSLRDRIDYTPAYYDVILEGDYIVRHVTAFYSGLCGVQASLLHQDVVMRCILDLQRSQKNLLLQLQANDVLGNNLGRRVQQPERFLFKSAKQTEGQNDSSSHRLLKPGDLEITFRHTETCSTKLQGEWCSVPSQTENAVHRSRLLRPCEFTSHSEAHAYSLASRSSDEDWCSATSHTVEASVPRMGLMKPCDFKLSRSSEYSSMSSNPEDGFPVSSHATKEVCLLRPCDISLCTSGNFCPSTSALGQVCLLLRPCDVTISTSETSSSDWFSTSSQPDVTSLSVTLLRPRDITRSGPKYVSFVHPYTEQDPSLVVSQTNIPLPQQLCLVRPCDLTECSGITTPNVITNSPRRFENSPQTSPYFSASTQAPVSFYETVYSPTTSSDGCSISKEVSPLPSRYLHRTASYSCRSSGSRDQSTTWSSSVSSGFSPVHRYPDLVDQTLASISLPNTTSAVRSLDDLTSWDPSTPGVYELGRGVHGSVHLYRHKQTRHPFAVKVLSLPKDYPKRHASLCQFKKELHFQDLVNKSPYFPGLYGSFRLDEDRVGMAMEFVGDEVTGKSITLYKALEVGQPALTRQQMLLIAVDVLEGLRELHDKGILINDLKNDNIMIRKEFGKWRGVLIDLGQACTLLKPISFHFSQREKQEYLTVGRYGHIAPELALSEQTASIASDVFQVGAVLIQLAQSFHFTELYQLGCICCNMAPSQRPSLDEAVECLDAIMRKYYQPQE